MFNRIKLQKYVEIQDFPSSGLYIVEYDGWNGLDDDVWYINIDKNLIIMLDVFKEMESFIHQRYDSTENNKNTKVMVLEQANSSNISEDFFLKAIALARMDVKQIEIDKILN